MEWNTLSNNYKVIAVIQCILIFVGLKRYIQSVTSHIHTLTYVRLSTCYLSSN